MRKSLTGLLIAGMALSLTACGSEEGTGVKANIGATVGITLPNVTSTRWLADGKNMQEQFKAMGYLVDLQYARTNPDKKIPDEAPKHIESQKAQIKKMVDNDAKLLVIGAYDGGALDGVLAEAKKKKIPVIAYDRLLNKTLNVDYQATFDNVRVGEMQGQLLADKLGLSRGEDGPFNVELFAGDKNDANARSFYDGSVNILKPYILDKKIVVRSGGKAFKAITTDGYQTGIAQNRMKDVLTRYYKTEKLDAVLSPYDGMSIGIINALKAEGYGTKDKPMPIVSGQDAELPSVQSVIAGEQTATIYKDTRELAKVAVQMGNALLTGSKPIVNDGDTIVNDMKKKVPTYLLYPIAVDKTNYQTLLVDGGYYTKEEIETPPESAS